MLHCSITNPDWIVCFNMKTTVGHRTASYKHKRNTLRLACLFSVIYLPVVYVTTNADPLPPKVLNPPVQILSGEGKPMTRVVNTKYGALRGFISAVPNRPSKPVEIFLGVPYASPPISSLRFMPPVTPAHWRGTRVVDKFSPVCPQNPPDIRNETEALKTMPAGRLEFLKRLLPYLRNQSEDCLYLNIYAPAQQNGKENPKVPVLVFIHGESYEWNAGNPYDGSVLASFGNVVVVTVNFRLGVLGFLPATEGSARGNYGLTDQVAALHWIQENIAEFGGDPKNVTLFGHGHGAACVNFLVLSPMAKVSTLFPAGLFHRAIMMSGSALSPWAIAHDANMYAQQVARTLGCPSIQSATLLECLRERSVSDILRVKITVPKFLSGFGPTVDGIVIQNEPLVLMEELADEHQYGIFDLMFGVTRFESYFHINAQEEKYGIDMERRDKLLRTLVRNIFNFHLQEIFLTIVNEYTDWTKPIQHAVNILEGTVEALGDALVVAPAIRSANYHSIGPRRSYFYVFSYKSENGEFPFKKWCVQGEDLQFVFGAPLVGTLGPFSQNYNKSEAALSEAVMTYWVNFARNGDPNTPQPHEPESSTDRPKAKFDKNVWLPYESVHQKFLTIASKPKVRDHYHAHRLSFWLHLFPQLHSSNSANISPEHHLLDDHDNMQSYDGVVRQLPYFMTVLPDDEQMSTPVPSMPMTTTSWRSRKKPNIILSTIMPTYQPVNDKAIFATTTINITDSMAVIMQPGSYSAALSVTIAVGCSLLVLNVLIFAGIYFQRDRGRSAAEHKRKYGEPNDGPPLDPCSTPQGKPLTLRAPPPSPVCTTIPQELPLHPPPQLHIQHHPHKILPKPCSVPQPPQIPKRESLAEAQPLLVQGEGGPPVCLTQVPITYSQNAQVHHQPNHTEINL